MTKEIRVIVNGTWHQVDIAKLKSLENIQGVEIKEVMTINELKERYPELLEEKEQEYLETNQ